jgi:flavin reductase (DIM6/NTAB) family NADH-FMN oxidoreductase RutF
VAGSEPSSERAFQRIAAGLDYPMFVVTVAAGGERSGCLIGFATQTSIDPPRFLVCLSRANRTHGVARVASHLGVHLVPEGKRELAEVFGGETGDEVDKFARCDWREGPHGTPLLDAAPDRFVGAVLWRQDAGDHEAFLLEPVWAEHGGEGSELDFRAARDIDPGHPA